MLILHIEKWVCGFASFFFHHKIVVLAQGKWCWYDSRDKCNELITSDSM